MRYSADACDELVRFGCAVVSVDSIGETSLSLKLASVRLDGTLVAHTPRMVANNALPSESRKFQKFGKLELVQRRCGNDDDRINLLSLKI